ncbi:MAG: hypothetical protein MJ170_03585, partial [Alphaproteobacteria bacterium]|nr:hypothetical protein [Alphaproteobacteria bacterium]
CQSGYYLSNDNTCVAQSTIESPTCNTDMYTSCQSGYELNNGMCVAQSTIEYPICDTDIYTSCQLGYYLSNDNTCLLCPDVYPGSDGGAGGINSCYLTTESGKYVATAGVGQTECVAGNSCVGETKVHYDETGGITPCACGTYQPATGQASCKKTDGGYYATGTGNTDQTAAGAGNWAKAGACEATACANGLTTIGYGAGADEEGDCGKIYHVGNGKIYLRSKRKTVPSLNFDLNNDGEADLYGNMSSSPHKMSTGTEDSLKIKIGATTYYVHDDSAPVIQ